ncbi:MAG: 3-deoxy-D-manno-octulosonic acid transferase [Paludibacteraceae bacterium]|nr:3-deoxy-D-manno-octulosonic acid transferase [Paludibacteraceae bacterium]
MYIYIFIVWVASFFSEKARKLLRGQRETVDELRGKKSELRTKNEGLRELKGCVWFHAASVGEFEQARPIIERIVQSQKSKVDPSASSGASQGRKILVTFFSPSGYEMRKDYELADGVYYLPFATRRNARRFLEAVQPSMAVFVKYEYWPAYLKELKKRNITTYIIAALFREDQLFFRWYGGWYRKLLRCFTTLFVQDERSRELLARYGIENVVVAGDTRFDRVVKILQDKREIPQLMRFADGNGYGNGYSLQVTDYGVQDSTKIIVAGSTWPKDEALLARYMEERPNVKLVLVPHELTAQHLHYIFNLFQGRLVRFSEATLMNVNTNRVLLIDKMGMLSLLYRYGHVAYIGGGFGVGIHNTLEAAVYSKPVLFGPRYHKFREAEDLAECGGGFPVHDYAMLEATLDEVLAHYDEYGRNAGEYVQSETGAVNKIYERLELEDSPFRRKPVSPLSGDTSGLRVTGY